MNYTVYDTVRKIYVGEKMIREYPVHKTKVSMTNLEDSSIERIPGCCLSTV